MEYKIQEKLEKLYNENIKITVDFVEFRVYKVNLNILNKWETSFTYTYNAARTLDSNVFAIESIIEDRILKLFYREMKDQEEKEKHIPYID